MRGIDHQQSDMFSYVSPEARVRKDHPLRGVRAMTDKILSNMSPLFDAMYAEGVRVVRVRLTDFPLKGSMPDPGLLIWASGLLTVPG